MRRVRGLLKLLEDIEPWFTKRVCDKNGNVYIFFGALQSPGSDYYYLKIDVSNGNQIEAPLHRRIVNDYRLEEDMVTKEKWDLEKAHKDRRSITKNIKNTSTNKRNKRKM